MASSLPNLCLRARGAPRPWSVSTCTRQLPNQTRCFTITRCHNKKSEADNESGPTKPRHWEVKAKRIRLRPSEIDAPRSTSSRKLLESFQVKEDEIDEIINEKDGDEYQQFLEQYGAAISPERPDDYDSFMRQQGFSAPRRAIDASDEGQMAARLRYQEKKIQTANRYLVAQNDAVIALPPKERAGFVTDGDYRTGEREFADELFEADDLTVLGHGYLEQHREIREYYRLAAWELPLLTRKKHPLLNSAISLTLLQNMPKPSNRLLAKLPCDFDSHHTWAKLIQPKQKL